AIAAIHNKSELAAALGKTLRADVDALNNTNFHTAPLFGIGGATSYKYQAHVSAMLKLVGFTDTDARAQRIVDLEHAIAEKHLSLAENEDIHKANNTWKQADFAAKAPGLDWGEYFRAAGLSKQASFIVWQPTAFAGESALVASTPLDTWKDWLAYHLIEEY